MLRLLEQFPNVGGPVFGVTDRAIRQMPVDTFPYHVVFKRFADRISVLAIAHDRSFLVIGTSSGAADSSFLPVWLTD